MFYGSAIKNAEAKELRFEMVANCQEIFRLCERNRKIKAELSRRGEKLE